MSLTVEGSAPAWAHDLARQLDLILAARRLPTYSKNRLPPATPAGQIIYVNDESGGAVLAFSDGSDWRRSTDRAVVS